MQLRVPSFESNPIERDKKRHSLVRRSDELEEELIGECAPLLRHKIADTLRFAKSLESNSPSHPSLLGYFSHPVRVGLMANRLLAPADLTLLQIALLHNCFEVCDCSIEFLEQNGIPTQIGRAIERLTLARALEHDPTYLLTYYDGIIQFGEALMLIKCLDKLDNLWSLEVCEDATIRNNYTAHCTSYVLPMAEALSPEFGEYFKEAISLAVASDFNPKLFGEWKALLATTNSGSPS